MHNKPRSQALREESPREAPKLLSKKDYSVKPTNFIWITKRPPASATTAFACLKPLFKPSQAWQCFRIKACQLTEDSII